MTRDAILWSAFPTSVWLEIQMAGTDGKIRLSEIDKWETSSDRVSVSIERERARTGRLPSQGSQEIDRTHNSDTVKRFEPREVTVA
jgi:hypothetical protein